MLKSPEKLTTLTTDPFHLVQLSSCNCGLDVLEMNILVLADVHDGTKEEIQALSSAVLLKKIDDPRSAEQVGVFLSDANNRLKVLSDVGSEHSIQALKGELDSQLTKVVDQPLFGKLICVYNDAFDGRRVLVVLQSSSEETSILTELGNASFVVMVEHLVSEDSIRNLGSVEQIHLEQLGLQLALLWSVVGEYVQ
jgi:hypothetical protein